MPTRLILALHRTRMDLLIQTLSKLVQDRPSFDLTPWQVARATSREVVLELSATGTQEEQSSGRVVCRVAAAVTDFGLEVCCDLVLWLDGTVVPWGFVQQSLLTMVPAVADVLLPETVTAAIGDATVPPPVVEIHLSTHRYGEQDRPVEHVVDVTTIGAREDARPFYGTGEVLDETLMDGDDWAPAVIDALAVMAMDWGFPSPVFHDQGLSFRPGRRE
ncbi:hypothetical protein [Actinacidiphila oryziradicis]|uniref:Uncharacterized protein n=1 Tax=Actinacidiphila oryziradicis TaxID=2571141 RepID=A0A4U0RYC2_9ACTN|nr:hypothetical protein [Actinacidiphila oryziradicis]TKA01386.1 hypothetical protein FCI23_40620 [Actinacidiphila oryziradicis]